MTGEVTIERFRKKYVVNLEGCWLWTGSVGKTGYGRLGGPGTSAHRRSYMMAVGPIPDGLELDHLCRVRCCVNPDHLEPVTHQENVRRGISGHLERATTHCPKGHPYDDKNTYHTPAGKRDCRECRRAASLRYRRRLNGD